MSACVKHRVFHHIVRQIVAEIIGVESKLQYFHAGEAGAVAEVAHLFGHVAQVLSKQGQIAQFSFYRVEKLVGGSFDPLATAGCRIAVGHRPVGFETTEVVQTQHVIKTHLKTYAVDPPFIAVSLVGLPFEERAAPELAAIGEIIGRCAGDKSRVEVCIHLEKLRFGPDLH